MLDAGLFSFPLVLLFPMALYTALKTILTNIKPQKIIYFLVLT